MRTVDAIRRSGIGIRREQTVGEAASIMERTGVGSLAVLDGMEPVGIVTDRDLVRRVLAKGERADARVDSVMSSPVITIGADAELHGAFALFRAHGVRRLAVIREGTFVGMLTVDDLLVDLANDLLDLSRPISAEISHAHRNGTVPAVP
jgi:CBS domain-containing protein